MVTFKNVVKEFGLTRAVNGVSFEIEKGKNTVLLGTSGCGKTTTLRMINRLTDPTSGTITLEGKNIMEISPVELRRHIGYVLQNHGLFPHYTIGENIAVVPELLKWPRKKIKNRIHELMEQVALPHHYESLYPNQLSGGQQQRVGIARALAADPPLLLMDEPFGALDAITRHDIVDEFATLEILKSKTILMVTHDIKEAFGMGDLLLLMDKGRLIQEGRPADLLFRPADPFVSEFLKSQQTQLEFTEITMKDIWPYLIPEISEPEKPEHIYETATLWQAVEKLNNKDFHYLKIVDKQNGEKRFAAYDTLFNALKILKSSNHE